MVYVRIYLLDKSCPPAVTVLNTASREKRAISRELTVSVLTWVPYSGSGPLERWRMSRSEPRNKQEGHLRPMEQHSRKHRDQKSQAILWEDKSLRTEGRKLERTVDLLGDGVRKKQGKMGASQKTKQRTLHGSETPLDAIAMFLWASRPQSVILRHSDH